MMHGSTADAATLRLQRDALHGLRSETKTLPSKYFYDARGCELFDQICELEEYYLTRTELSIMRAHAAEIAAQIGDAVLIELGSGSSVKTRLLLDALPALRAYVPIDIACDHLQATAAQLQDAYPRLSVLPACGDFTRDVRLPESCPEGRRVVYFPGSTLGNFEPAAARALLRKIAATSGRGGGLLIGIDLVKDPRVLEQAYNDRQGVTAAFNLNLLQRLNAELKADFQIDRFRHFATFNAARSRIEMHLESTVAQQVEFAGASFDFRRGETILTELSHKYQLDQFTEMAQQCGLRCIRSWTDERSWFAVVWAATDS